MAPRETELRVGGLRLWARFTLLMSLALALVMAAMGFFLYTSAARITRGVQEATLVGTARAMSELDRSQAEVDRLRGAREALAPVERKLPADVSEEELQGMGDEARRVVIAVRGLREELRTLREKAEADFRAAQAAVPAWKQVGSDARQHEGGRVKSASAELAGGREGRVFQVATSAEGRSYELLVPSLAGQAERGLLGLIVGTTILVVLVGAGVAVFVANQVSGPLETLVDDVRQISTGDLSHRTRVKVGGELALLARAIDRMTKNLADARETELELSIREREVAVAAEVREALLPQTTPTLSGYDLGAAHLSSAELWGDFHDFVELPGGRQVGLLVCDVSGKGLPGALVGATARSYLRSHLQDAGDVKETLEAVNRELARDVRRGVFVTALYVLVDSVAGIATVACAGHKIPLVRYTAADRKVRLIQPEGIALGFDKGPVFERSLNVQQVPIEPGDRLVLVNTGAVLVADPEGNELGEKPLYTLVLKYGGLDTPHFLQRMRASFESHAGDAALPRDISIVTVARKA